MASKASGTKPMRRSVSASDGVETFLASLDHPFKDEIIVLRGIILSAAPGISEGIKWNAPSFHTSEYFATFQLRAKQGVQIILHLGAKVRDNGTAGVAIDDPESLLTWLAADRAMTIFSDMEDIIVKRSAFTNVIRQWITHV